MSAPDCRLPTAHSRAAPPRPIPTAALPRPMGVPGGARDAAGRLFRNAVEFSAVALAVAGIMAVCTGLATDATVHSPLPTAGERSEPR